MHPVQYKAGSCRGSTFSQVPGVCGRQPQAQEQVRLLPRAPSKCVRLPRPKSEWDFYPRSPVSVDHYPRPKSVRGYYQGFWSVQTTTPGPRVSATATQDPQ